MLPSAVLRYRLQKQLDIQPSKFGTNFPKLKFAAAEHPHSCQKIPLLLCSCILYTYNFQIMDRTNP